MNSYTPESQFEQYVVDRFSSLETSIANHLKHHEKVEAEIISKRTRLDYKVWGALLVITGAVIRNLFR